MKVAFHFDESLCNWGREVVGTLSAIRRNGNQVKTKIFTGSLLFLDSASELTHEERTTTSTVNEKVFEELVGEWASYHPQGWCTLRRRAKEVARREKVFAVCFETVDVASTALVDQTLQDQFPESYLGALEVDESLASHLGAYRLSVLGRIDGDSAFAFWDGITEDNKMVYLIDWLRDAGYCEPEFESLEGRYTIFDLDHGAKQSLREAQCRKWMRQLLDSVNDHVLGHLTDGVPAIQEKLWQTLNEFQKIEVPEQASYIALGCRRVFECVADDLFPPTDERPDGRDLGTDKFKNRLLKYLEQQRVGQTEVKLIEATMTATAIELDNLCQFANKGLHSEFVRSQARRCLLHTILLLDSLISVRSRPLEMRIRQDETIFRRLKED